MNVYIVTRLVFVLIVVGMVKFWATIVGHVMDLEIVRYAKETVSEKCLNLLNYQSMTGIRDDTIIDLAAIELLLRFLTLK